MGTRSAILAAIAALLLPDGLGNVQLAQSPPQFDSSLKAATTAFVRSNGVSYGGQVVLSIATTMTAALHAGKACTINAAVTQTLPVAATCPAGTIIRFQSTVGGAFVIRQGTDEIAVGNGNSTPTISIGAGDTLVLMSDGVANWIAIGGSVQLGSAAAFGSSIAASGYQKLPSGLIIQWGTGAISGTSAVFNFPLQFPNAALVMAGNDTGSGVHTTSFGIANAAQFTAYGSAALTDFQYIVIGH